MSLKYPTKENSSCMLLGTIGNPNSNSLNKDIIIMNKKKNPQKTNRKPGDGAPPELVNSAG